MFDDRGGVIDFIGLMVVGAVLSRGTEVGWMVRERWLLRLTGRGRCGGS